MTEKQTICLGKEHCDCTPDTYIVIHRDGDHLNNEESNLARVKRKELEHWAKYFESQRGPFQGFYNGVLMFEDSNPLKYTTTRRLATFNR